MAFPALAIVYQQRRIDELVAVLPVADDQGEVILVHLALAEAFVQFAQRAAALGHDQATGGFPVDPVHEAEILEVGPRVSQ